jgi:arylsulfatase A-like enzyme
VTSRIVLTAVALLVAGCRGQETAVVEHLLDAATAVAFSRETISSLSPATVSVAEALRSPAQWSLSGADPDRAMDGGMLWVTGSTGELRLDVAASFEAASVDVVRVTLKGLSGPARPELSWRRQGEDSCADCFARMLTREGSGSDRSVFSFEVGARAEWHGTIVGLSLRPTTIRGNRVGIGPFSLLKRAVLPAGSKAFNDTYLVSADGESRPGQILLQSRPFRTRRVDPAGKTLKFSVAREPSATSSVRLRVSEIDTAGSKIRLFETDVPPGREWQSHEVELGGRSREAVELIFECESSSESPGLSELVFLSGVELERPGVRPDGLNVLLISIDTLRADRLSTYGYSRPTSPNLDALVRTGATVFERVVAAASSTLPAHASMFSGLEVFEHGAFMDRPMGSRRLMLAELFQMSGYRTLAITGGGYVDPRFGLSQGFDRFRTWPRGEVDNGLELSDGLDRVQDWLDVERRRPFFFFFHTYEVHAPYRAREPYFSRLTGRAASTQMIQPWGRGELEDDGYLTRDRWPRTWGPGDARDLDAAEVGLAGDLYDSGVARADFALGELLRFLKERGLGQQTLVVFTSDHGESLGENGLFDHGYMYDTNLLVPLVIFDPRQRSRRPRIAEQVRQVDIMPTILELAGLAVPPGISGVSLLGEMAGAKPASRPLAWSYGPETNHGVAFRKDGLKFILRDSILRPRATPDWEAYALESDPTESLALKREAVPSFDALRSAAIGKLENAAFGVVVSWDNRTSELVRGVLEVPGFNRHNSKLAGPPNGSFRMPIAGELRFEIPAGESSRARFQFRGEAIEFGVTLEGRREDQKSRGVVRLAELCEEPRTLLSESPVAARGTFRMVLSGGCEAASGVGEDPDLAARLRALGYLQ